MLKNTLILFLVILLTISSIAYSLGLNDLPISMLDNIRNVFRKFFTATTSSADGWSQCITPLTQTCTQYCQSQGKTCSNTCNNGYGVNKGVLCYQNANCPANDPLIASTSAGAWCGDSCYGYASGKCCCAGGSLGATTTTINILCTDSDGGDNIYVKGTIEGPKLTTGAKPIDYCLSYSPNTLVEYSCEEAAGFFRNSVVEGLYSKSVNCPNGCSNGKCNSAPSATTTTTTTISSADGWSQCITPLTQTCTQYCQSQGKTCSNTCNNGYGVNKGVLCYQNANCPANDPLIASTSAGAWCGDSCYGYASGKCCCSGSSSATTTTTTTIACPGLCYSYYPPFSSWTCTNNICNYDIESLSDHYNCPISQPICTIYRSKVTCGATNNDCLSRCSQSGCAGATTTTSTTTTIPTTTTTILKTTSTTQPTLSTTTTTENNDFDILNFGCTKSLGNHKCSLEYSNNLNNGANIVFFYVDNHGAVIKSTINFVQKGNGKMEELFICNLFEKGSYKVFYKIYELIPRIEVGNENLKNPKKWAKTTEIKEVVC